MRADNAVPWAAKRSNPEVPAGSAFSADLTSPGAIIFARLDSQHSSLLENFLRLASTASSAFTISDRSAWICGFSLGKAVRHFVRSRLNRSRRAICSGVGMLPYLARKAAHPLGQVEWASLSDALRVSANPGAGTGGTVQRFHLLPWPRQAEAGDLGDHKMQIVDGD